MMPVCTATSRPDSTSTCSAIERLATGRLVSWLTEASTALTSPLCVTLVLTCTLPAVTLTATVHSGS